VTRANPIFLLAAAAIRSKKSAAAADDGGLGVYCYCPCHPMLSEKASFSVFVRAFARFLVRPFIPSDIVITVSHERLEQV